MNSNDIIEYVGMTDNIKRRFYEHTERPLNKSSGKFYQRTDINIEIIKEFISKQEALDYEHEFQREVFGESNRDKLSKIMKEVFINDPSIIERQSKTRKETFKNIELRERIGEGVSIALKKAYNKNPNLAERASKFGKEIVKCNHCGKEGSRLPMSRFHFNNCKHKTI